MVFFNDPSVAADSIDAAEVTTALKHLGEYKSQQQVTDLIKEVDSSGNGSVEFGEFIYMVGQIRLGKNNGLGKIVSSSKVSAYKFTDAELAKLKTEFASYDTSGDGRCVCGVWACIDVGLFLFLFSVCPFDFRARFQSDRIWRYFFSFPRFFLRAALTRPSSSPCSRTLASTSRRRRSPH
jgi:hypothetical protein